MIKCMFLLYRAPHLTREEFLDYWSKQHSKMAIETAPMMGQNRYVQNHPREHAIGQIFKESRGCQLGDFDGVAEATWNSFEEMEAAAGNTPEDVARAILEDEARFVDMKRSIIWFAEEKQFWPVQN